LNCTPDENGKPISSKKYDELADILVADDWIIELNDGHTGPDGALLGAGGYKAAIRVSAFSSPSLIGLPSGLGFDGWEGTLCPRYHPTNIPRSR
jgi:hypothetical protein